MRRARRTVRPGRELMRVLVSVWPVRVHLTTDSNAAEAGDGPLPVAGGTGLPSATFSRACASVSRRSHHLVVLATGLRPEFLSNCDIA